MTMQLIQRPTLNPFLTATLIGATTITLNLSLPANRYLFIHWGDGDITKVSGAVSSQNYAHNYTGAGTYQIRLSGDFRRLTRLRCSNWQISGDIANLSGLTSLTYLYLRNTSMSGDIINLSGLTSLTYLYLNHTSVSGDIVNLSGLISLTILSLYNIPVSGDIANLNGLTSLTTLNLCNSSVSGDIASLSSLTSLVSLSLNSTSINTYTQGVLPDWDACDIYIQNLGLSVQEVSDFLCDLNTASSASVKTLHIQGTNAIPNAAGLACKDDDPGGLVAKGWTVVVST